MFELITKAIGLGIVLVFMIGPVFFSLIQTSIQRGFIAGMFMAFGIAANDATFILISYFGFSKLMQPLFPYLGTIGGIIFIVIGAITALNNRGKIDYSQHPPIQRSSAWKFMLKGYLVNAASPFVIIFWIATVSTITSDLSSGYDVTLFFSIVVATILIGDILKSALANRLKRLVTNRLIRIMNYVIALILIGAGIHLFFSDIPL